MKMNKSAKILCQVLVVVIILFGLESQLMAQNTEKPVTFSNKEALIKWLVEKDRFAVTSSFDKKGFYGWRETIERNKDHAIRVKISNVYLLAFSVTLPDFKNSRLFSAGAIWRGISKGEYSMIQIGKVPLPFGSWAEFSKYYVEYKGPVWDSGKKRYTKYIGEYLPYEGFYEGEVRVSLDVTKKLIRLQGQPSYDKDGVYVKGLEYLIDGKWFLLPVELVKTEEPKVKDEKYSSKIYVFKPITVEKFKSASWQQIR